MDPYLFVLKQRLENGQVWTSQESFEGHTPQIRQAVAAGYLNGHARWAETESGMFIFGIDSAGKEHQTGTTHPDFSE